MDINDLPLQMHLRFALLAVLVGYTIHAQNLGSLVERKGKCPEEEFSTCEFIMSCNNDFDCQRKEKCCDRACGGKVCRKAIIDGEAKKLFKCPVRWVRGYCTSDEDCRGNKKCCPNDCGCTTCKRPQRYNGENVCPAETVTLPLKHECADDDECRGRAQKCCPNECGVRTCTGAQEIDCATVRCADPNCGPGEIAFTPEHSCCQSCKKDCRKVFCLNPVCRFDEERVFEEGECCFKCVKDCKAAICLNPVCQRGEIKEVPKGECCPICKKDCSTILCPAKQCLPHEIKYRPEGECCDSCKDCSNIDCLSLNCKTDEIVSTPEGKCCAECKKGVCYFNGKWYDEGDSFKDNCNTCGCQKGGNVICTLIACAPCTVKVGGLTLKYPSGTMYHDGCNTCNCSNGVPACSKKLCFGCLSGLPAPNEDVCTGINPAECPANHECDYPSGSCCRQPRCDFPLLTTHCSNDLACPSGYYCTDFVGKGLNSKGFCCLDCKNVRCAEPLCKKGYVPYYPKGECCKQCKKDCSAAVCPKPVCNFGEEQFTPPDKCCPICKQPNDCYDERTGRIYPDSAQFQYQCNGCFCSGGQIGCTKIGCGFFCESGLPPHPTVSCSKHIRCQVDGYSCENNDKCCKDPSCPGTLEWISQTYCNADKKCPNGYGCYYPGPEMMNGFCCQGARYRVDECTTCECLEGEFLACYLQDCAPPPCVNPVQVEGQCCRQCIGCLYENIAIAPGEERRVDDCTTCSCSINEELECFVQDCPRPECDEPLKVDGQCCGECPGRPCENGGLSYQDGDRFYDECNECTCEDGQAVCTEQACDGEGCYFEGQLYKPGEDPSGAVGCDRCLCVYYRGKYEIICTECCVVNSMVFRDDDMIPRADPCKSCTCLKRTNSYIAMEECAAIVCAQITCDDPNRQDGGCCGPCLGSMIPRADPCKIDSKCVKRENSYIAMEECTTVVCAEITCSFAIYPEGQCCGFCLDETP